MDIKDLDIAYKVITELLQEAESKKDYETVEDLRGTKSLIFTKLAIKNYENQTGQKIDV